MRDQAMASTGSLRIEHVDKNAAQEEEEEDMYSAAEDLLPKPTSSLGFNSDADTGILITGSVDSDHTVPSSTSPSPSPPAFLAADADAALAALQQRAASTAGTIARIPNVTWADVGGLGTAKAEILDTIELPLRCARVCFVVWMQDGC